ncbi:MAG: hypothetical protein FD129_1829 [bacterium]|nr:MAG: hypothetical protein FD129_1829 [bacterium]
MRLNEKRIGGLAASILDHLLEEDLVDFKPTTRQMTAELARFITADLSNSRKIPEGTTEWMLLLAKHKDEIAAKRGYTL